MAIITVHPGGIRELHWHQNADEWQYYLSGKARMTIVGAGVRARTMDFEPGDVGYVEKTLPHYIENTGPEELRYLEVFRAPRFEDLSLSEWLSHTPAELVMAHLNIDRSTYQQIPPEKLVVVRLGGSPTRAATADFCPRYNLRTGRRAAPRSTGRFRAPGRSERP